MSTDRFESYDIIERLILATRGVGRGGDSVVSAQAAAAHLSPLRPSACLAALRSAFDADGQGVLTVQPAKDDMTIIYPARARCSLLYSLRCSFDSLARSGCIPDDDQAIAPSRHRASRLRRLARTRTAPRPARGFAPRRSPGRRRSWRPPSRAASMARAAAGTQRLYGLCAHLAVGAFLWGYNIGILTAVLVHPGWRAALGRPTAPQRGLVTAVYYVGTFAAYVALARPLADGLGRRRPRPDGAGLAGVRAGDGRREHHGAAVSEVSRGRVGVGGRGRERERREARAGPRNAHLLTRASPPSSEVSPAKERGKFMTMNHVGLIVGLASGLLCVFPRRAPVAVLVHQRAAVQGRIRHDVLDGPVRPVLGLARGHPRPAGADRRLRRRPLSGA